VFNVKVVPDMSPEEQLLRLTREMFKYAGAADWEKLAETEQSRLPLFHQVFDGDISAKVELARQVLAIDEKTKKLAEIAQPLIQQDIIKLKNSGKVNAAYQNIQNLK
jgi:Flagellar protein FliT